MRRNDIYKNKDGAYLSVTRVHFSELVFLNEWGFAKPGGFTGIDVDELIYVKHSYLRDFRDILAKICKHIITM